LAGTDRLNARLESLSHDFGSATSVASRNDEFVVDVEGWNTLAYTRAETAENDVRIDPHQSDAGIAAKRTSDWRIPILNRLVDRLRGGPIDTRFFGESADGSKSISRVYGNIESQLTKLTSEPDANVIDIAVKRLPSFGVDHLSMKRTIVRPRHGFSIKKKLIAIPGRQRLPPSNRSTTVVPGPSEKYAVEAGLRREEDGTTIQKEMMTGTRDI
jgi:hypothetical protein